MTPRWVEFDDFERVLSAARDGLADVVIGNVSVTAERAGEMAFSRPLSRSREWLLGFEDGERLGLPAGTAYFATAATRGLENVVELPGDMLPDQVFDALIDRQIDRTIMDAVTARYLLASTEDLEDAPQLLDDLGERPLAWVVRKDSSLLLGALNEFIDQTHLTQQRLAVEKRRWPAILGSGVLRMITVTGPHTYFLYKGELAGFEYELLELFAAQHELAVEVVVASDRTQARAWLESGRGDVVAAAVTATAARRAAGWRFTEPYMRVDEVVVAHADGRPVETIADLAGREVFLDPSSSHWQSVSTAAPEAVLVPVQAMPEQILHGVATGAYPLTVADSHLLEIEQAHGDPLVRGAAVAEDVGIAWVIREEQTELANALGKFVSAAYRGLDYNLLVQKYFGNERRIKRRAPHRVTDQTLSPYDAQLRSLADTYGFDWRLLVAQMYQESEFKPRRTSFAGARGLMQVMPRTARQLGVDPERLFEPAVGLNAGVRYLDWCRERFEGELPLAQRIWFALAAYNAGPGHVRDARRLARQLGLEPDVWFGNVEQAMLKLSLPEYANKAAHGYVRGEEPVNYVAQIRERYQAYVDHLTTIQNL